MPIIVVTTDLSAESKRAFAPARALCMQLGGKIELIAVLEDLPFEPTGGGLMAAFPDRRLVRADYIAMATHGRSGLRRLLLGSVAEQVIRHSHVPVIVYPPPA